MDCVPFPVAGDEYPIELHFSALRELTVMQVNVEDDHPLDPVLEVCYSICRRSGNELGMLWLNHTMRSPNSHIVHKAES